MCVPVSMSHMVLLHHLITHTYLHIYNYKACMCVCTFVLTQDMNLGKYEVTMCVGQLIFFIVFLSSML